MPHPLSIQRAGMMEDDELPIQNSTGQLIPYPRRVPRVRHSSDRLLVKICTDAVHRKRRSVSSPSPATSPRSSPPPPSSSQHSWLSVAPPIFSRLGFTQVILPLEVINMIVTRHLQYDTPTLKSFSLSCRYFCGKARPLIFSRLRLYMHPTLHKRRGADLSELFTTSRHLLPHIKHAMVFNLFPEDSCAFGRREDKEALRVLMNLSALSKISIHGYNNKSWVAVPRDIQLAIKTSLRGKRITAVEVVAMSEFPVYLLEGCRLLKELTLAASPTCYPQTDRDGVAKRTMTFAIGGPNPSPIYLEKLSLTMPTPQLAELTDWILSEQCSLDVSRVKSMHIRHRSRYAFYEHQMAVSSLLRKCSATVQELELDAYTPSHTVDITAPCTGSVAPTKSSVCDRPEPQFPSLPCPTVEEVYKLVDIGQLQSLRRLSLSFGLPNLYDERKHVSLLSQMFRNIGQTNATKLKEIGIFLWITSGCRTQSEDDLRQKLVHSGSWDTLDRVLSMAEGDNEGGLESLKIQLTRIRNQAEAAHLMAICLPRLTKKGVVNVHDRLEWIGD